MATNRKPENRLIRIGMPISGTDGDSVIDDPIVDEVRRAGEAYMAQFNFDLHAACEDLRRRTEETARGGRVVVSRPPRRIPPPEAKKAAG
jgi:hypothetical protein